MEAGRVAHAIDALPRLTADPELSGLVQQVCLEMFFAHVRALIEFLEIHPSRNRTDYSASGLVPGWSVFPSLAVTRLQASWSDASVHVMHFSKRRAKQESGVTEVVPAELSDLLAIADDLFSVWDEFALAVNHPFAPVRAGLSGLFGDNYEAAPETLAAIQIEGANPTQI
jgi:hypothetical protein